MTKEQALQAFRDNQPVTMKDSCLYQIVEINRFGWRKGRGYLPDGRRMRGYVK